MLMVRLAPFGRHEFDGGNTKSERLDAPALHGQSVPVAEGEMRFAFAAGGEHPDATLCVHDRNAQASENLLACCVRNGNACAAVLPESSNGIEHQIEGRKREVMCGFRQRLRQWSQPS